MTTRWEEHFGLSQGSTFIEAHARKIAYGTSTSYANVKQNIEQCISYSIWSSIAEANFCLVYLQVQRVEIHKYERCSRLK